MKSITELNCQIEQLREQMNLMLEKKEDTLNVDVIEISKKLDKLLNEYEEVIKGINSSCNCK